MTKVPPLSFKEWQAKQKDIMEDLRANSHEATCKAVMNMTYGIRLNHNITQNIVDAVEEIRGSQGNIKKKLEVIEAQTKQRISLKDIKMIVATAVTSIGGVATLIKILQVLGAT